MPQPSDESQSLDKFVEYPSKTTPFSFQLILAVLGGGLLLIGLIFILRDIEKDSQVKIIPVDENQDEDSGGEILVHVAGAVQKPGVYRLAFDARMNDALVEAGGLTEDANRNWFNKNINLAQKVSDGVKIYIPFIDETASNVSSGESGIQGATSGLVNINTASQAELESLPKIGPVIAKRIIDYRESSGQFQSIEDLTKITGISQTTLDYIRNKVTTF